MTVEQLPASGARSRTRNAIIEAAIRVMGRDASATLGDVASGAGVGRTTLHRYFPDRSNLLEAISSEVVSGLGGAIERARIGEGTGSEALRRMCREYFELGDLLNVVFTELVTIPDEAWGCDEGDDDPVAAVVIRGHNDGSIDPQMSPRWIQTMMWSLLYAGWSQVNDGATKHDTLDLILRTMRGAVSADK
ncbi:TetR/AcrR family transcriptional regulator [Saxibacter everestensis]|uniref:TetR/AcrR family transcriptional regulator n=1 Tax=Saxibacter everestensis TaxID=2909229 RepID=A0ABY8QSS3_9MICO|nr:TetR/AcrR family transcriptional regulator [Brevibacteriaceae bacterium ZFBP1038]